MLIIIGDPVVLSLDPLWKSFINYIHLNGGYKGKKINWDPVQPVNRDSKFDEERRKSGMSELDELIRRTKEMVMNGSDNSSGLREEDAFEGNVDKPWREDE